MLRNLENLLPLIALTIIAESHSHMAKCMSGFAVIPNFYSKTEPHTISSLAPTISNKNALIWLLGDLIVKPSRHLTKSRTPKTSLLRIVSFWQPTPTLRVLSCKVLISFTSTPSLCHPGYLSHRASHSGHNVNTASVQGMLPTHHWSRQVPQQPSRVSKQANMIVLPSTVPTKPHYQHKTNNIKLT